MAGKIPMNGFVPSEGETASLSQKGAPTGDIRVGKIISVMIASNTMNVEMLDGGETVLDIPIHYGYAGPMGMVGACPEEGALAVFVKTPDGLSAINYLPASPNHGLKYEMLERFPESASDDGIEEGRLLAVKHRLLNPGDAILASGQGSEVLVDNNVEIHDEDGNELILRSGDGSFVNTSAQSYMFNTGVWRSSGLAQRNSLVLKKGGEDINGLDADKVVHSDGTESVYIGGKYQYGQELSTEYRLEVDAKSRIGLPSNDINTEVNITRRVPTAIFTMGNYIGNNPEEEETYGKHMAPRFFGDELGEGSLDFVVLNRNGEEDQAVTKGIAWGFHVPEKFFIGADREGQMHQYMGASVGDEGGRSLSLVAQGSRKELWGSSADEGLSWELGLRGGLRWNIGRSNQNTDRGQIPRSVVMLLADGSYTEYGRSSEFDQLLLEDFDDSSTNVPFGNLKDYKKIDRIAGDNRIEVEGKRETIVDSDEKQKFLGTRKVFVGASDSENIMGDKTISTAQAITLNATTEMKVTAPKRTEKFTLGSDEKTILLGNSSTDIVVGNKLTSILTGNITETLATGNKSTNIGVGSVSTTVGTGSISLTTGAGAVSAVSSAGTVTLAGTTVSIAGQTSISAFAPQVYLGNPATISGVITMLSHRDYITGAPLLPSFSVFASL